MELWKGREEVASWAASQDHQATVRRPGFRPSFFFSVPKSKRKKKKRRRFVSCAVDPAFDESGSGPHRSRDRRRRPSLRTGGTERIAAPRQSGSYRAAESEREGESFLRRAELRLLSRQATARRAGSADPFSFLFENQKKKKDPAPDVRRKCQPAESCPFPTIKACRPFPTHHHQLGCQHVTSRLYHFVYFSSVRGLCK
ncbi:hypothetical protein BS78_10G171000 [Paspalum vaginatum]|nr:hypothetical protein BS78_10G171000 [Paspalum vaginatum]